ncbi:MAG TPA: argininosuccinate lyase [bacterium]|nr:argininosuccinate lyase [bacterium]
MKYMWEGRFAKNTRQDVIDFTSSLDIDRQLAYHDIEGSSAHCKMLKKAGILTSAEAGKILKGLEAVKDEIADGKFIFIESDEDIHTSIERRLVELTGKTGEKLHTARSRNDQIVLDEKLFIREKVKLIIENIRLLQKSMLLKSEEVFPALMSAYTHLQQSQPVLVSHYFLAYIEMLERDRSRMEDAHKRNDILPSGSCACCGTSLDIDRRYMAELLGFSRISANSLDTVSDRDFLAETLSACATVMVHLSRFAEDMIIWNTTEFGFIELPDEYCTGSSIMPQKKNPDILELVRGKSASCIGALTAILTLQKGLPLSYNRDLQEDKRATFHAVADTLDSLKIMSGLTAGIMFRKERLYASINELTMTTDIAEYLVRKNMPFREAHAVCGRIVRYCMEKNKSLKSMGMEEWKSFSTQFSPDIKEILSYENSVKSKKSSGGTSPELVRKEIRRWKKKIMM